MNGRAKGDCQAVRLGDDVAIVDDRGSVIEFGVLAEIDDTADACLVSIPWTIGAVSGWSETWACRGRIAAVRR